MAATKTLNELEQEIAAKQAQLDQIWEKYPNMKQEDVDQVQQRERELKELTDEATPLRELKAQYENHRREQEARKTAVRTVPFAGENDNPATFSAQASQEKTLGQLFIESKLYRTIRGLGEELKSSGDMSQDFNGIYFYKEMAKQAASDVEVKRALGLEQKTTMTTAAGWAPQSIRIDRVALDEQRIPNVAAIIPKGTTDQAAIVYMEETTFTNNAGAKAENSAFDESALALTERTRTVRKVGTTIPVTYEQLEDVSGVRSYLDNRLGLMLEQSLEDQIVTGDGNSPNFNGYLTDVSQSQAKGTDPTPDAFYKGMVTARVTGRANPTHILIHPLDWQDVRLLRTADGVYIYGSPSDPGIERMWGLPVVQSTAETQNTGLVGDFTGHSQLYMRAGVQMETTNSHASEFTSNVLRIKIWLRGALVIYRPSAFVKVTGI